MESTYLLAMSDWDRYESTGWIPKFGVFEYL